MIWNNLHQAVEELYPNARVGLDWNMTAEKEMFLWNEAKFGPVDVAAIEARTYEIEARPKPIPRITPRQLRLWLLARGVTPAMVEAQLAGNDAALIEWEYATEYDRAHPMFDQIGAALGLTPQQIDQGFREAAQL